MKRYEVSFGVQAPFISRGTKIADFGIDLPMARNEDGEPVLHGTHVWGKIRDALIVLNRACAEAEKDPGWNLPRWLGGIREVEGAEKAGDGDEETGADRRRLIHCSDFVVSANEDGKRDNAEPRVRIAIDPILGAAATGALQAIEEPWAPGTVLTLNGKITLVMPDAEADLAIGAVRKALEWANQFGALGSVGFGVADEDKVTIGPIDAPDPPSVDGIPDRIKVLLDFDGDPFFVAERRETENSIIGTDVIPGGVFIGALANLMNAEAGQEPGLVSKTEKKRAAVAEKFPRIVEAIDALHVSHFKPVKDGAHPRPRSVAQTVFQTGKDATKDALPTDEIVRFAADLRSNEMAELKERNAWPSTKRELRIRTAINPRTGAAQTNQLFGLEMCCTKGRLWQGLIDLAEIDKDQRPDLIQELGNLLRLGLPGIGRSKAFAKVTFADTESAAADTGSDKWKIVLETPAVLRPAEGEPTDQYKAFFSGMSDASMEVEHMFLRERLVGAEFMARRMHAKHQDYAPQVLCEAGSVFIVKAADGQEDVAREFLRKWAVAGMPEWPEAETFFGRRNGYGEIRVEEP